MFGQYKHNIDAKGRLFIPARFREKLGESFYVTIGLGGCLAVYSARRWQTIVDRFEERTMLEAEDMRSLFANTVECEPDGQGRILIPPHLRKYAALEKEVVITGMSNYAELWNPERWEPINAKGMEPEELKKAMGRI